MSILIKINPENPEPERIGEAVAILKKGGVIAFPTETFYGLGADAANRKAVESIFEIKGRSFNNPIPLVIGNPGDLVDLVEDIPPVAEILMSRFWPGPLTLVFRASRRLDSRLTAGTGKIGIRISSHPVATALAGAIGGAITATSANRSGEKECTSVAAVIGQLGGSLDVVMDGGSTTGGTASTILDVTGDPPRILRQGVIPADRLRDICGKIL